MFQASKIFEDLFEIFETKRASNTNLGNFFVLSRKAFLLTIRNLIHPELPVIEF